MYIPNVIIVSILTTNVFPVIDKQEMFPYLCVVSLSYVLPAF